MRLVTPEISVAARRICLIWGDPSPHTIREIVQEVFLKLCEDDRRILRELEDRGNDSFLKLLRMVAASVGTDHFRRVRAEKRGGSYAPETLDLKMNSEDLLDRKSMNAVEWPALMAQLDRILRSFPNSISKRDRSIFWLYYRQGMTAEAISKIPGVGLSGKGVESALQRMVRILRGAIEQRTRNLEVTPEFGKKELNIKGFSPAVAINNIKGQ